MAAVRSACGRRGSSAHGIGERLPAYLITELVGLALGMGAGELQIDRHLEESVGLLQELRLA